MIQIICMSQIYEKDKTEWNYTVKVLFSDT